jgi:hypothetical protein
MKMLRRHPIIAIGDGSAINIKGVNLWVNLKI